MQYASSHVPALSFRCFQRVTTTIRGRREARSGFGCTEDHDGPNKPYQSRLLLRYWEVQATFLQARIRTSQVVAPDDEFIMTNDRLPALVL